MTAKQISVLCPENSTQAILQYFIMNGKIRPADFQRHTGFGVVHDKSGRVCEKPTYNAYWRETGRNVAEYHRHIKANYITRGKAEYNSIKWALSDDAPPIDTLDNYIDCKMSANAGAMDLTNLVISIMLEYGNKKSMIAAYKNQLPEPETIEQEYAPETAELSLIDRLHGLELVMTAGEVDRDKVREMINTNPEYLCSFPGDLRPFELEALRNELTPRKIIMECTAPKIKLVRYSEKSYAAIGEGTYEKRERLKSLNCRFNRYLTYEGRTVAGWVMSLKTYEVVKKELCL